MSKAKVIGGFVLAALAGIVIWKWRDPMSGVAPLAGEPPSLNTAPPVPARVELPVTLLPIAADMARLNSPETLPQDDLSSLSLVLATYGKNSGGNPTGENEEITAALLGNNPKRLAYLPANVPFVNASGQLIDRWGTPYFFHSMTAGRTDIRSAGPDRQMWTEDDIESSN
ncbi:hypothetical protein KBB96_15560 [Luteolibacter ambystomatis]|uniref:Type II secretion system protein GspG C-terminal domain-containing protein n=1 Tax=Luteolibacter ambystomatis TaxID=2824561 RepID=A0A975IYL9_9BACT|nr:type II secretion system protein GspG [Luteolibacter ambystomatis]QUE50279.1 hypothetical protein KBB96_15560 [Luteolibacter ambystomatis]